MTIGIDIRIIGRRQTGSEAVFFNLVKNLSRIDEKNDYLLFTDRAPKYDRQLENEIKKLGLRNNFQVISLGQKGINKFVWNFWTLSRYLRKNPIDIYLTQYIIPVFLPRKTKVFTIVHDVSFRVYPELIRPIDRIFIDLFLPPSLRRADKIVAVSKFTKSEIEKYYPFTRGKVECIYNAVSENFLSEKIVPEKIAAIKKRYALPEKFILYLGTLQPRKNIPVIIKSLPKVLKKIPDLKLVIAGGPGHNLDYRIKKFITELELEDKVVFTGFIAEKEKASLFQLAELFCFPSLYEGFGIPILEAFAQKIPTLASDIPPHREIVGDSAILFDPKDPSELADKIIRLLWEKDKQKAIIQKQSEQLKNFSWNKTAQKFISLFQMIAQKINSLTITGKKLK